MRTVATLRPKGCRLDCWCKKYWNFTLLPGARPESRQARTTGGSLFTYPLLIEESVHAAKQNSVLHRRSSAVLYFSRFVSRDQQLAGSACSEQLDSHKNRSDHHSMKAVDSYSVNRMKIRQWLTGGTAEGNVSANLLHRPARFDSAYHISLRQMLVLKTHVRLHKNSHILQLPQGRLW